MSGTDELVVERRGAVLVARLNRPDARNSLNASLFRAIGAAVIALTLIGYLWAGPWFELWMAFVNGGGLLLGGLWMRRS